MSVFFLRTSDFYVLRNYSLLKCYENMYCIFSCESFRVLLFTLRRVTHLELIFLYGVRWVFKFTFFPYRYPTTLGPFIVHQIHPYPYESVTDTLLSNLYHLFYNYKCNKVRQKTIIIW